MAVEVCLHTDGRKAICSLSGCCLSLGCSSWMRRTGARADRSHCLLPSYLHEALSGRPGQRPGLGHRHALDAMHAVCDQKAYRPLVTKALSVLIKLFTGGPCVTWRSRVSEAVGMRLASEAGETREGWRVEGSQQTPPPIPSHPIPSPCHCHPRVAPALSRHSPEVQNIPSHVVPPFWSNSEEPPTSPSLTRQAQKRLACAVQPQSGPLLAPARLGSNFTLCNFFSELSRQAASPSYK